MERHVDFAALAAEVDRAAPRPNRARGGRPPFPTEVMVRILLIQQLFKLSDEQMECQLLDRLSFQRFAKLRDTRSDTGYKGSANADKRYKLVRKIKVSAASEHDTLHPNSGATT